MMVMGISTNPAPVRAIAPVVRLAMGLSLGNEDECLCSWTGLTAPMLARRLEDATCWRRELRDVKYNAEPRPVRRAEGAVPRQRPRKEEGPDTMVAMVWRSEAWPDCCTRVLRRSAGCSSTADSRPELKPAVKWKAVV